MCGLCGTLGDGTHWADGVVRPGEPPASAVPWLRRQARRQRMALSNAVLRHYGLRLSDWQGLADLWPKAERMAGAPLDPLDPALLDALERHAAG